jgi:Velvet factor
MLDPPLVIELIPTKNNTIEALLDLKARIICFVTLSRDDGLDWSSVVKKDESIKTIIPPTDLLYGQRAGVGIILDGIGSGKSLFYVFPDLAVRVPGVFMMKIEVLDMVSRVSVRSLKTKKFEVFSPKRFPGMMGMQLGFLIVGSTVLTNHLLKFGNPNANLGVGVKKRDYSINKKYDNDTTDISD